MTTTANGQSTDKGMGLEGTYPESWDEFIGQENAKRQLKTAARSAKIRGVPMRNTLISSGTPGVGKTSLALLVAQELNAPFRIISGATKPNEARLIFHDMVDGDVLIVEEIHRMVQGGKKNIEWMLHYLENKVLLTPLGPEEVANVTVIATTTDTGALPDTILTRFGCKPAITDVTDEDALQIARGMAEKIFGLGSDFCPFPTDGNLRTIASACNNNPRDIRGLLENLFDMAIAFPESVASDDGYDLTTLLADAGLTTDGLNSVAQRYLISLQDDFRGEAAGLTALKERLREPGGLGYVERVLQSKHYIEFTKQGRMLSGRGIKRVRALQRGEVWEG